MAGFQIQIPEVSHAIGMSFKDSSTGQFVTADETTCPTIPSDCKTFDVSTAYIVDVPPFWSVEDPQSIVKKVSFLQKGRLSAKATALDKNVCPRTSSS